MKIANKTVTATQLVKDALRKAKEFQDYNIFVSLNEESALKKAAEIDQKIAAGEDPGRLAGVPYALKDNFLSPEGNTTASSKILAPLASPITATAVKKLEAEGAIMIGRTNMDSFAHGSSTENSYFGPTLNAHDKTRVAGGSSGGSAVAVALGIVEFATGTDTGGSIRQPASFNGVYGFKPTYGTISRYGVVAMASSTDCIGFFANSPADMDLLMQITSGQDPYDMTTLPDYYTQGRGSAYSKNIPQHPVQIDNAHNSEPEVTSSARNLPDVVNLTAAGVHPLGRVSEAKDRSERERSRATVGVVKDFDNNAVSPAIRQALAAKVKLLERKGHQVVELDMPTLKYALAVYYIVVPAEIASNLSRHDGIRYGHRATDAKDLDAIFTQSRSAGFMPENKRRIMIGNFVLSSGFYDAYYLKAQQARTLIINEYEKAFQQCDFLLTPVAPSPAFKLGEKAGDPVSMYLEDVMSVPLNLAGVPGLAVPAGQTTDGLPIGLQLIGPRRSDPQLLKFAEELQ